MPGLQRRELDFQTFDALTADVAHLHDRGYEAIGRWSLEQILDHLAKTMAFARNSRNGPPLPVRWVLRPIARRLLRTRKMPTVPAPKKVRPLPTVEPGAHERFAHEIELAQALTGDRINHPLFGQMTVNDWQQLQLIHASRHLSFLIPR